MATMRWMVDEESMVREQVEQVSVPKGIRLKSVQLGSDWEGNPAWKIVFSLSRRAPSTQAFIQSLNVLIDEVIDRVTGLETDKFPYVNFEAVEGR